MSLHDDEPFDEGIDEALPKVNSLISLVLEKRFTSSSASSIGRCSSSTSGLGLFCLLNFRTSKITMPKITMTITPPALGRTTLSTMLLLLPVEVQRKIARNFTVKTAFHFRFYAEEIRFSFKPFCEPVFLALRSLSSVFWSLLPNRSCSREEAKLTAAITTCTRVLVSDEVNQFS